MQDSQVFFPERPLPMMFFLVEDILDYLSQFGMTMRKITIPSCQLNFPATHFLSLMKLVNQVGKRHIGFQAD